MWLGMFFEVLWFLLSVKNFWWWYREDLCQDVGKEPISCVFGADKTVCIFWVGHKHTKTCAQIIMAVSIPRSPCPPLQDFWTEQMLFSGQGSSTSYEDPPPSHPERECPRSNDMAAYDYFSPGMEESIQSNLLSLHIGIYNLGMLMSKLRLTLLSFSYRRRVCGTFCGIHICLSVADAYQNDAVWCMMCPLSARFFRWVNITMTSM